jgi:tetratricopeptide (TPR) repeat protein
MILSVDKLLPQPLFLSPAGVGGESENSKFAASTPAGKGLPSSGARGLLESELIVKCLALSFWVDCSLTFLLCLCCLSGAAQAQFEPLVSPRQASQAQSAPELDEYIDILEASSARDKVRRVEAFAQHYPNSELLGIAYQYQMLAYRELNDYDGVIQTGERALKLHPDNLNTLLTLANVLPNRVAIDKPEDPRLVQAERYARLVFDGIGRMKLPRSILPQRWEVMRLEMEASAHEALGHVATKRGDLQEAISEFEKAVKQNPNPQGSQFYRLGVAYMLARRYGPANEALSRAAALGPEEIRKMANTVVQKLKAESH